MDVSHLLNQLNDKQRQAVSAPLSHILVLAGAGSGKTRVLIHRIAWLVQVEQASPFSILAVTFTNKAAGEMRGRAEALLNMPAAGLWLGTFHGIAHRLLRTHWKEAGLPQNFQILDSQDQQRLIKRVIKTLELDEAQWPAKQATWFINSQKEEGKRAQHIADNGDPFTRQMVRIYSAYEQSCQQQGVIDFAELLLRSLETLKKDANLLAHYHQRFQHILVDEFQDTNGIQYALLRLLAGKKAKVFAVGDDDQSIYGWRGAKIEHIQQFSKHFSNTDVVRLEQNYRSTGNILEAANTLIANNEGRLGKELWTDAGQGEKINRYIAFDERDEARFVIGRIQQWVEQGGSRSECAILYRSNAQSRTFEEQLITQAMPYRVYGGLRFFERAEIKDALAYMRLISHRDDNASFERAVNQPTRGIGERTMDTIRELAKVQNSSLWQAAQQCIDQNTLSARAHTSLKGFLLLVDSITQKVDSLSLDEKVVVMLEATQLKEAYNKEGAEKSQTRKENLDELATAAKTFEYDSDNTDYENMTPLDAFLSHAVLESGEGQADEWEDAVQLMTLHTAKGLEFPLVFMVGLEEGLFPHQMSIDEPGRLEEERRLCYVGMTRAREKLIISHAESRRLYGRSDNYCLPSRFLDELPKELLEDIRPPRQTFSSQYDAYRKPAVTKTIVDNTQPFKIGQSVSHAKFGEGVVLNMEGSGDHARVEVNFEYEGSKWLVIAYANLTPL